LHAVTGVPGEPHHNSVDILWCRPCPIDGVGHQTAPFML
jgi:hypothetical protein